MIRNWFSAAALHGQGVGCAEKRNASTLTMRFLRQPVAFSFVFDGMQTANGNVL
jgi:hypothetical protein